MFEQCRIPPAKRSWQKLDANLQEASSWDEVEEIVKKYVYDYNYFIPHMTLERKQGIAATPSQNFTKNDTQNNHMKNQQCSLMGNK